MGFFLLLLAFLDGVLHHVEEGVPPTPPFRCSQGHRWIFVVAELDGFRVGRPLVLTQRSVLVFGPLVLPHH